MPHLPDRYAPHRMELNLSDREFLLLRQLVHERLGIHWEAYKREMVFARLRKRLRQLRMVSFRQYYEHLLTPQGTAELQEMINAVTTNKTAFFREKAQFDFLEQVWLRQLREDAGPRGGRKLRLWSAGCATGEEPYTLAILLAEGLGVVGPLAWDVKILATDVNTRVLNSARTGIYSAASVAAIPDPLLRRHFLPLQPQEGQLPLYQIRPALRALIDFRLVNLVTDRYPINTKLDLIFCRNVMIYFQPATQMHILARFHQLLQPGGMLFLGHSESSHDLPGLRRLKHNIFQKVEAP